MVPAAKELDVIASGCFYCPVLLSGLDSEPTSGAQGEESQLTVPCFNFFGIRNASGISQVLGSGHPTRVAKCNEPHVAKAKTRKPSFARFHKGQMIAVKGEACRVPATESPSALGPQNISRGKVSLFILIFTASFQVISCHFTLFHYQLIKIN